MSARLGGWALIGAGRLGTALALRLTKQRGPGLRAIVSKHGKNAQRLRRTLDRAKPPYAGALLAKIPPRTRLLLLAVSDREVRPVAQELADLADRDWDGVTVLHFAGALGLGALAPLAERGAHTASLHPMQSFGLDADRAQQNPFRGVYGRIGGVGEGKRQAQRLAARLGVTPLKLAANLAPDEIARYHLASSLAANDFVALFDGGSSLLQELGVPEPQARQALIQLVRGALDSLEKGGVASGLTGPASRGDSATVEKHLSVLATTEPELAQVHALLSNRMADIAHAHGLELPKGARRQIRRLARTVVSHPNPR